MAAKITIAVDGHSSTGKSTLARQLAQALGYSYVDSGAMYRCVTLYALTSQLVGEGFFKQHELLKRLSQITIRFVFNKGDKKNHAILNGEDVESRIRGMEVSQYVSQIAAIPEVRKFLVAQQKAMGKNKGVVMDGRDIGTVVFPDAELKIFMTASAEIRAKRRYKELQQAGKEVPTFEEVLANVKQRDHEDSTRQDSPLRVAADAKVLDNSDLNREDQFEIALNWAKEAIDKAG